MTSLKSSFVAVGAALVGGVCGGLVVAMMAPAPDKAPKLGRASPQDAEESPKPPKEDTTESVDALRMRLASLERRVSLLTFAQEHRSPTREVAQEGAAPGDPSNPTKTVDDPVFEAAVRDVFDRVEDERDAQRNTRRDQRQAELAERWLSAINPRLELREDQQQQIKAILQKRSESMRALRDTNSADRPVLRSEWRAKVTEIAQQTEAALAAILDASQKEKYEALDEEDKIGSTSGGFGRFGGGENRRQE